jgi:predicted dehydrogenase
MKKIKFAIIGCGRIGKRHAEMIVRNPEAELVALCDIKEKDELNIEQYDVPFFKNIEDLLSSDTEMDVVNICTPNGLHTEHSNMALKKQKHIVCEKPLGLSKNKVESVLYNALQVSKKVFAVMQNRYSPPSVWIKDIIDKKILGEIFIVQINCFWNRDKRYYKKGSWKGTDKYDGGTLFTQFSHFVDIMYWLFGDIKNIKGKFNDFTHKELTEFEDSGLILFDFVNGGMGNINYSTAVWESNLESSMTIIGKNGSVKIGGQYMNEVVQCNIKDYDMPKLEESNPANEYNGYKGSAANHHYIIQNVVDTLNGRTTITTNAMEGLKVVEIIEKIYKLREKSYNTVKS